jgi:hypothetical protein
MGSPIIHVSNNQGHSPNLSTRLSLTYIKRGNLKSYETHRLVDFPTKYLQISPILYCFQPQHPKNPAMGIGQKLNFACATSTAHTTSGVAVQAA